MDRIDEIKAFATVADMRSFTQAARKLGVSGAQASKLVARCSTERRATCR
jgi:DNA-binding transcriptional LysR family regulator